MNDLKNSTVEELIEKMVRKNYIDVKEKSTIEGMLKNVTGNIRDINERALFINTLSLKLDAQDNEFVTPNGLNYASFESFLKETVEEVKKIKTTEEVPTIDITEEAKTEEEIFDIEKYEAEVKSDLDDLLNYVGLEGVTFSDEEVAEIAKKQRIIEKAEKRFQEKLKAGMDIRQAKEETW